MKRFLLAAAVTALSCAVPAVAANVSVSVGQPGFFGRVDIGGVPAPVLIAPQPVIIRRPAVNVVQEPVYLHVPPREAKDWRRHCGKYDACGRQVYFVDDRWYNDVYVPHHHEHFHDHRDDHRGPPDRDHHHGPDHDDHDHDHGPDRNHDREAGR